MRTPSLQSRKYCQPQIIQLTYRHEHYYVNNAVNKVVYLDCPIKVNGKFLYSAVSSPCDCSKSSVHFITRPRHTILPVQLYRILSYPGSVSHAAINAHQYLPFFLLLGTHSYRELNGTTLNWVQDGSTESQASDRSCRIGRRGAAPHNGSESAPTNVTRSLAFLDNDRFTGCLLLVSVSTCHLSPSRERHTALITGDDASISTAALARARECSAKTSSLFIMIIILSLDFGVCPLLFIDTCLYADHRIAVILPGLNITCTAATDKV